MDVTLQLGTDGAPQTAIIVAIQLPGVDEQELTSSMDELKRLATTLGLRVVARMTQRRGRLAPGIVVGEGKLKELAQLTGGPGEVAKYKKPGTNKKDVGTLEDVLEDEAPDEAEPEADVDPVLGEDGQPVGDKVQVVLIDHDVSPTQQRNLEIATGAMVLDRTQVILEIFHRHAKTKEARLQVEVARLKYEAPRLRDGAGGGDRVRGGVGGKGAGETAHELDRRRIRDRIAEIRDELEQIEGSSKVRRTRRSDMPTVALVGYTNAGKSSLMRAMTASEVYVADKLFATLDTTIRTLMPPTEPQILVSDTVGFIKKLPHDLVASFRSTLDEANECDLLLHVVDASDPSRNSQLAVTREVLGEIGATSRPAWLLLNKIDKVDDAGRAALVAEFPDAILLSAKDPADAAALRDRLIEQFAGLLAEAELVVPWAHQRWVHQIHERCTVLGESHTDDGTLLHVRAPTKVLEELQRALADA